MRIPLATEGYIFILPLAALTALFGALSMPLTGGVCGLLFLFVTYFFRDPDRPLPPGDDVLVSPADGKVIEIVTEKDPFEGKSYTRITIFLSVFNVHVNRIPIDGKIERYQYHPGKFMAAWDHKASLDNEQNALLIAGKRSKVLVKQIAGLIARRIICRVSENQTVERGQRYGLIRFGSRVDVFVPENTRLAVALGDRVRGGSSPIGTLPPENAA